MYAVLLIPEFALQAVLRAEPGTAGRPAALFSESTKKSIVTVANRAARASGVELQMTAPQAVARCPDLVIRGPKAGAEAEAHAALLAVGFTLAPLIEDTAPGVCTVDLKGTDPVTRRRAAESAVDELAALGFEATAGIAATPLLALYAARHAAGMQDDRSSAAAGPELLDHRAEGAAAQPSLPGLLDAATSAAEVAEAAARYGTAPRVMSVSDPKTFLGRLPLGAADPPPGVAGVLANWGLRTFADLTALPRDDIGRRLGPEGLALWDRAHGGAPRPLRPVVTPQTFSAAMDFEEEIETLEPLLFILRRFVDRLALELRTSGHVAATLDLTLRLTDDTRHERSFRLPEPTAQVDTLFRTLHTHLESLRTDASIVGVALHVTPARPLVRQQGLFDTGLRDPHGFAETLARVSAIVGSDRVGTPQFQDTHRPDAVNLVPPPAVVPPPSPPPVHPPVGLPLRRFRPPLRAQLELTDGKPTYVWTESFNGPVAQVRGPWLSSGDWWQPDRTWRRTEYDIALATGGIYRLVLVDRCWFIEGEYD